ncbi:MAG: hypothetical protein SGARI_005142 [Bacillariaceae sp.]
MSGGTGGKWVSSRARAGGMGMSDRFGGSGFGSQKLDTEDENLFPDLASADKIMEQKKSEQPAFSAPKKTPVGGGASWGAGGRPKLNLKSKKQTAKEEAAAAAEEPKEESKPAAAEAPKQEAAAPVETKEEAAPAPAPAAATSTAAAPAPAPIKPKKKKKKDLSTFGKK